jgi:hypothetical protein
MEANAAAKGLQAAATELGVEGGDSVQAAADECRAADEEAKAGAVSPVARVSSTTKPCAFVSEESKFE